MAYCFEDGAELFVAEQTSASVLYEPCSACDVVWGYDAVNGHPFVVDVDALPPAGAAPKLMRQDVAVDALTAQELKAKVEAARAGVADLVAVKLDAMIRQEIENSPYYEDGDEEAPFFTETFLYCLLGKDDARAILGPIRRLQRALDVPPEDWV